MNRRQFVEKASGASLLLLATPHALAKRDKKGSNAFVFLEAEQFAEHGGWDLDQQSMDQMGSPYLLAHGLGIPVADATTSVSFPTPGTYRVWVRTRDWVAPWGVEGAPGKFQLLVDGRALEETFGTKNADWHWHDGGTVKVGSKAEVALHDLTGFEGRCEAVLFCKDTRFEPSNDVEALSKFRRKLLGLPKRPANGGNFHLAVIGGGLAGICAALAAARNGLNVALVQDRPVLGGNGSSEVRVWPEGHGNLEPYPHVGDIIEELCPAIVRTTNLNGQGSDIYDDARKLELVRNEPRITLFDEQRAIAVETKKGKITAVIAQHTRTSKQTRITATLFSDCTGDATIGALAGADFEIGIGAIMGMSNIWSVLDAADPEQVLECECKDKTALAMSCEIGETAQPFPPCPWAIDLSDKPFPGRKNYKGQWGGQNPLDNLGGWFWESGFDRDPISELERIRDLNFRAMYGAWDTLKNVDGLYPNHRLGWAAFIAGKRESRRLLGDIVLSADHFRKSESYPDGAFPCTWNIDLHEPHDDFDDGLEGDEFISYSTVGEHYEYAGPFWAPYRCLYSRNIPNLFMAGRDISVTQDGLGPVRVMRTCGMMGEIVGKAATLCITQKTTPRGVYQDHLEKLKELMNTPGNKRSDETIS